MFGEWGAVTDNIAPPNARRKRQGPRPKHVPVRTCVICREQSTKRQLVRIVRQPDGFVVVDSTGRLNGRGAYLCDRPACWQRVAESDALGRALNTQVTEELRQTLRERAQAMSDSGVFDPGEKVSTTNVE